MKCDSQTFGEGRITLPPKLGENVKTMSVCTHRMSSGSNDREAFLKTKTKYKAKGYLHLQQPFIFFHF